jgi:imidazolonepropionase-like amidohydrolase
MKETVRHHAEDIGADNIKLSMSGEEICEARSAQDCFFSDEETKACVEEAHRLKKRVCSHARARDSITMCLKHGVDVIYHASYIDDEGVCSLSLPCFTW